MQVRANLQGPLISVFWVARRSVCVCEREREREREKEIERMGDRKR